MERYAEYRDSGVEWIGKVPAEWEVVPIWTACIDEDEDTDSTDFRLALDNVESWTGKILPTVHAKEDSFNKSFVPGDVLFSKLRPYLAKVALPQCSGKCSSEFLVLRPSEEKIEPRYLFWLLISKPFIETIDSTTYGSKMPRTNWSVFGHAHIPMPSRTEQHAIASYLDAKTAEIDSLIADTEKSIELLEEYRKAIISEAVTKGLNPDAPLKDSGIEWVGEIPAHWKVVPLSLLTSKIGSGKTPKGGSDIYADDGVLFLRSQNVYSGGLSLDNATYISEEIDREMQGTRVYTNDVLLNITGGSIGRCCVYNRENHANVNQHVCILRPMPNILPEMLQYSWNSNLGTIVINICQMGQNRESINFEQIGATRIPLPPLDEQKHIVTTLRKNTSEITNTISLKRNLISSLKDYRKSLISEAVTGTFKVPGVE